MIYYNLNKKYYYILMSKEIIKITASASKKLSEIASIGNNKNLFFSLKGGGCNGYKYNIEPMKFKPSIYMEVVKHENYNLYICDMSIMHLFNTTIDWKKDLMGETFEFVNPNVKSSCGCGTSFTSKH